MDVSDLAEYFALARDVLLILLIVVAILSVLLVYRKVSGLVVSVRSTVKHAEDITSVISQKFIKPVGAGSGIAFGAGRAGAFLLSLFRRGRRKGRRREGNGQE